jgi:hypothetical protein
VHLFPLVSIWVHLIGLIFFVRNFWLLIVGTIDVHYKIVFYVPQTVKPQEI